MWCAAAWRRWSAEAWTRWGFTGSRGPPTTSLSSRRRSTAVRRHNVPPLEDSRGSKNLPAQNKGQRSELVLRVLPSDLREAVSRLRTAEVNAVAGLLKLYFRELPEPLLPAEMFQDLARILGMFGLCTFTTASVCAEPLWIPLPLLW